MSRTLGDSITRGPSDAIGGQWVVHKAVPYSARTRQPEVAGCQSRVAWNAEGMDLWPIGE